MTYKNRTIERNKLLLGLLSALLLLAPLALPAAAFAAPQADQSESAASALSAGGKRAVVRGRGALLRQSPNGRVMQELKLATAVMAGGRTADSQWIMVEVGDDSGWVHRSEIIMFGVEQVPVIDVEVPESPPEGEPAVAAATSSGSQIGSSTTGQTGRPITGDSAGQTGTVTTSSRRLNVRKGPGTNHAIVGTLPTGARVNAIGRNEKAGWIQIDLPDSDSDIGWVSAAYLNLSGDAGDLPVSEELSKARVVAPATSGRAAGGLTGKLVFQERSGGKIHVYNLASGRTTFLTNGMDPAISPDGGTVAFVRDGNEDRGVYLIDINGANERRIFSNASGFRSPSWSPDGELISFSRVSGEDTCRDVGHGLCLPDGPGMGIFPLVRLDVRSLGRVDRNGGNFLDIPSEKNAAAPHWGERGIVYHSRSGLEIIEAKENPTTRSVINEYRYQDPNWKPGEGRIVFHSEEKDHWEIFVANDNGTGVQALTRPATTLTTAPHNVAPVWSPDGKFIVFVSNRSGKWALWVMNADGSNQRRLPINLPIDYTFSAEQVVSWGK